MKFYDLLDTMDVHLAIERKPNQNGRYMAFIKNADTKEGCILTGATGNAKNPKDAVNDYIRKIVGKTIVLHAMSKELRKEFICPLSIEFIDEL